MGVEAVIATQVIDTTSVGRSLMTAADAAAARTALSLGTLATQNGTISDYLTTVTAAATYQTILVSGTSIKTVNGSSLLGSGDLTVSGLSGTGSVDNAALRADGTGGATLQNSSWIINDNLTASPNNTVNHACLEATGGTANVSVSIKPKGTGAFCLTAPDGTTTGGNARGANAVDLRTDIRAAAGNVAAGSRSFLGPAGVIATLGDAVSFQGTASGLRSVSMLSGTASGTESFNASVGGSASGERAVCFSYFGTAAGPESFVCGPVNQADSYGGFASGIYARSRLEVEKAHSCGRFSASGDCQVVLFQMRCVTTTNTAVELLGSLSRNIRFTIPAGYIFQGTVKISGAKSDGSAVASYLRQVCIKRVSNTTSLVGSVTTVGTDVAAGTSISITADDTNEALKIEATGVTSETWRWQAVIEGGLYAFGT